jgi:hypothetical protein
MAPVLPFSAAETVAAAKKAVAPVVDGGAPGEGVGGSGRWASLSPLSPRGEECEVSPLIRHPAPSPPRRGNGGVSIASLLGPLKLDGGSGIGALGLKRHDD